MFLILLLQGHNLRSANVLEHQRPQDLGLLNEAISLIETTSDANEDRLGISMIQTLKSLVEIEGRSAMGHRYAVWVEDHSAHHDTRGNLDGMSLPIPYFGSIRIAQQDSPFTQSLPTLDYDSSYTRDLNASGAGNCNETDQPFYCLNDENDVAFLSSWLNEGALTEQTEAEMDLLSMPDR